MHVYKSMKCIRTAVDEHLELAVLRRSSGINLIRLCITMITEAPYPENSVNNAVNSYT